MKTKFVENTGNIIFTPFSKDKIKTYKSITKVGRTYQPIGETSEHHDATMWRVGRVFKLISLSLLGTFCIYPLFKKTFRKRLNEVKKEIKTGNERVIYYAPNTKTVTDEQKAVKKELENFVKRSKEFFRARSPDSSIFEEGEICVRMQFANGTVSHSISLKRPDNIQDKRLGYIDELLDEFYNNVSSKVSEDLGVKEKADFVSAYRTNIGDLNLYFHANNMRGFLDGDQAEDFQKKNFDQLGFPKI